MENRLIPPHLAGIRQQTRTLSPFPVFTDVNPPPPALPRPASAPVFDRVAPQAVKIYDVVRASGLPNYRGAQIPVHHDLNMEVWKSYAHLLEDTSLLSMLEFGFPAGYVAPYPPPTSLVNHSSALGHAQHVAKYIETELGHRALIGPFPVSPFRGWTRENPLMTRPKRDSSDMRVILDLSFPEGSSVNSAIPRDKLDGAQFKLRLPSPDMLARRMLQLGRRCLLYKIDLSRAYRQLRSDPLDWPLLGIQWQGKTYLDTAIPFGLRHGASACQRTSEAIVTIAAHECSAWALPYIDDTAGAALPDVADAHYQGTLRVMDSVGLQVAPHKCQAPNTLLEWIGVLFNSLDMSMSIAQGRIDEAVQLCLEFLARETVTKKFMQRFLGKILHATKCTEAARRFTAQLLDLLRASSLTHTVPIDPGAYLDATWLACFLSHFNGRTLIRPSVADVVVYVDACLEGVGGHCPGVGLYATTFPGSIVECGFSISSLECYNSLLCARLWAKLWSGRTVLLYCDNWAAVCAANSGRAEDPLIRASIRELWLICAISDVQLTIRHRPGHDMMTADALSRAGLSAKHAARVRQLIDQSDDPFTTLDPRLLAPPMSI